MSLERCLERLGAERPRLVIDREWSIGEPTKLSPLMLELLHRTDRGAEASESTGAANRGREFHGVPRAKWRADNRCTDVE